MGLILGCIIWFFLIYGVIAFVKNWRKNKAAKSNLFDEYLYDKTATYDEAAERPVIAGDVLNGSRFTEASDYRYSNNTDRHAEQKRRVVVENDLDGIVNDLKYGRDNISARRVRGAKIASYLNSNIFGNGIFALDMIPHEKVTNSKASMHIPDQDLILALMDDTAFGSAKDGIALTVDGIYWKFSFDSPSYISWEVAKNLYDEGKVRFHKSSVDFDGRSKIPLSMTQFSKADALMSIEGILKALDRNGAKHLYSSRPLKPVGVLPPPSDVP